MRIPNYSFTHHNRTDHWTTLYGANVIILEGIYALYDPRVLALTDLKIFVDTELDVCLARRLTRDIVYRGREIALSVVQWQRFVKLNFERFVRPTMYNSDIRIPRGIDNVVALDMLVAHIQRQLAKKSENHLNHFMALSRPQSQESEKPLSRGESVPSEASSRCSSPGESNQHDYPLPSNVIEIEQTPQVQGIHTILLNSASSTHARSDFIFYFDRIASLIITRALDEFDYAQSPIPIKTATGLTLSKSKSILLTSLAAAVQLVRGGQCFERSLKKTLPTVPIGKVLIQSDARTGEPHLHSLKLPPCLDPRYTLESAARPESSSSNMTQKSLCSLDPDDCAAQARTKILLCEAQMSSGAAVTMSVAILLDHGVREENIIVVAYLASEIAVRRLSAAFPKVKIVVGIVDHKVYPRFVDNAYFGTV